MKYYLCALSMSCCLLISVGLLAQNNYTFTNFRVQQQTYTDITATGTAIPMTNPEDGESSTPQEIGFTFQFNGTAFTQFMIHADGILRLGTAAPGAATSIAASNANSFAAVFTSTGTTYQNILLPFFTNLVQGSATPEFHVETSGTAPGRICTIQWKNLRDADNPAGGQQHQFDQVEFQVKLHETTNDIEFVYGNWVPSPSDITVQRRNAACGIKAGSTSFLTTFRSAAVVPFAKTALLDPAKNTRLGANAHPYSKNTPFSPGFTMRFFGRVENDISAARLYIDSLMPAGLSSTDKITALIRNEGTATASDITVSLQVTGANTHAASVTIASLAAGQEQIIGFPAFDMPNEGAQNITITASHPADSRPANNTVSSGQVLTKSFNQVHDYSRTPILGVGFNGQSGIAAVKMYNTGVRKITQVRIPFSTYRNQVNLRIYEDGGAGGTPSATPLFTSPSFLTTSEQEMVIPVSPPVTVEGDYFIGIQQQTTNNMGWGVVINTPIRYQRILTANSLGTWGTSSDNTPWEYLLRVFEESGTPDIGIESLVSPGCTYTSNAEVKVSLRNFSSQAIDFSSTPTTVTGKVTNPSGTEFPFSILKNTGTLAAGASEELTVLNSYDFTPRGIHRFDARTNLNNDAEPKNDSLLFFLNNSIPVTRSFTDSVCPLTSVTLTAPAYLANVQWQQSTGFSGSTNPLTLTPAATTIVVYTGTDYRGCLLRDSVIVPVKTQGLPPRPQLIFGDSVLSHRNQFKDTVRVNRLDGHTIEWLGGVGTVSADTALIIDQIAGMQVARVSAAYRRTADGCANISDTIRYSFAPGVLLNNSDPLTVCDTSFYDAGGPILNTGNSFARTFTPATPGKKLKLTFYRLDLANFASLEVFDGPFVTSPRIVGLSGTANGNSVQEFISSNESGQLTVLFNFGSFASQGWWAGITCHTPEVYRTVQDGNWVSPAVWERRAPGGQFVPAVTPPRKGDDTVYIRHLVTNIQSTPMDQIVVEEGATLNLENPTVNFISMPAYKTVSQPEFLVHGTLNISPRIQIFGANGQMIVKGRLNNFGQIDFDSVVFNGTSPQILGNFSGAGGTMKRLHINNPAGLTLGSDQLVTGLRLVNGLIATSSENALTLRNSSETEDEGNPQSYVEGPLTVELTSGFGNRLFPIGKAGKYRPVEVNNNNANSENSDLITAEVIPGPPTARSLPPTLSHVSEIRYYRITRTGNAGTAFRVRLPYGDDDQVADPAGLAVAKDDGAGAWLDMGGTASGPAPGSILSSSFDQFSDFVLANRVGGLNPLPVVWQQFTATRQQQDVLLQWRTGSEQQCRLYEIERSRNGRDFEKAGTLACSNLPQGDTYRFTDRRPGNGTLYYRIRQLDADGRTAYSVVRKLNIAGGMLVIYPNPAADYVQLNHVPAGSSLRVLDATGRHVLQRQHSPASVLLNISGLPSGFYQLQVLTEDGGMQSYKLQVLR